MNVSPFNKLSAELRNRIYELTLVHDKAIDIDNSWMYVKYGSMYTNFARDEVPNTNALIQTCRQIRAECIALYYASNEFRILAHHNSHDTRTWLPPLAEHLHSLGVQVLGKMKSFTLAIGGKRAITLAPKASEPGKMLVTYSGYRMDESPSAAFLFDPIVDVYEELGFTFEEKHVGGQTDPELEDLENTDAQELRDSLCSRGRRFSYRRHDDIWVGGAHLKPPSRYFEASIESLGWRWEPWLRILRHKGLKFNKKTEGGVFQEEHAMNTGRELVIMRYKRDEEY